MKFWKKLLAFACAAGLMMTGCAMADALVEAGGEMQSLPETSADPAVQQTFSDLLKNEKGEYEDYYKVVYEGYFDLPMVLTANDVSTAYDMRMYLPADSRYMQASIVLCVPSETDPYTFMVESGWKAMADEQKMNIFLLMPTRQFNEAGEAVAWGNWSNFAAGEAYSYISGAVSIISQRPGIQTVSYNEYIIGYGDAADIVTGYVQKNPYTFAGAFVIGATGAMEDTAGAPSRIAGIALNEVALPFGVVSESDVTALVDYFKSANKTVAEATECGSFTAYAADPEAQVGQPDSESVAGVYVKTASVADCMNKEFAGEVLSILNTVRRYPGFSNTHLRAYEDVATSENYEYYTSLSALGRLTYGGDIAEEGDGNYYNREWWMYVPESAKARMANGEKVEVLFCFMGSNGYGDEAPQRTGWSLTAEKNGFVVVSPSGYVRHQGNFGNFTRNGVNVYQYCTMWNYLYPISELVPDDLIMIEDIYNWLFTDCKYAANLDQSKVFASGQSAGGGFTHYVGMYLPDLFTGVAACSWVTSGEEADTSSDVAWVCAMGQNDTTIPGALSVDTATAMFANYAARYNAKDASGKEMSDWTFCAEKNGETSVATVNNVGVNGGINEYILATENGVPMFTGIEVVAMGHATVPAECDLIWDTIFSHFNKDPETHVLYFDGAVVDTPVNTELAK